MGLYKTLGNKQTVGPHTSAAPSDYSDATVIEPEQGRDIEVDNFDNIVGNDLDGRVSLGTYTLNNRGMWEELILNDSKTGPIINQQSFLFETRFASQTVSEDGSMILSKSPKTGIIFQKFSIEALPYRTRKDKETNENINVPLVLYYDKEINEDDYYAATDGKVNLKIFIRSSNRNVVERNISRTELYTCDEAFFTGTAAEVTSILEIDHRKIKNGETGQITSKLRKSYQDLVHGRNKKYSN